MKTKLLYLTLLLPFTFLMASCSSNTAKADEPEIETMDSVSKGLEKSTQDLDEETKKLEASLEKIEKEY